MILRKVLLLRKPPEGLPAHPGPNKTNPPQLIRPLNMIRRFFEIRPGTHQTFPDDGDMTSQGIELIPKGGRNSHLVDFLFDMGEPFHEFVPLFQGDRRGQFAFQKKQDPIPA